ncbi:MAG TPA: 50S ribosomal protein L11 methyltransferase [Candidatus Limnocylindria bacterium]
MTSKGRRRRTATSPISSAGSKTRWAAASTSHPRWLEIAVPANVEAVEAVSEILSRYGHNGIAVEIPVSPRGGTDHTVKAYLVEDVDAFAKVSDARDALGHLQAFGLGPIGELAVRTVDDEDWLEAWKATVTPIRIGRFLVRPTWSDAADPGLITIALDPGMAFGTGLHPTTQQCLEAISYLDLDGQSVLDVGTGSGILAIAAAKRGAGSVVAVDIDPLAVRAAGENAAANAVSFATSTGSAVDVAGTFDIVLANLVGPVLVELAQPLRARVRSGGTLVTAGTTTEAEPAVVAAFVAQGLGIVDRDERAGWVRLILTA